MTSKAGYPTLRLIRYRIGPFTLNNLQQGEMIELEEKLIQQHFNKLMENNHCYSANLSLKSIVSGLVQLLATLI